MLRPGQLIPPLYYLLVIAMATLPVCLLNGALFSSIAGTSKETDAVGRTYLSEAVGALAAGLLSTAYYFTGGRDYSLLLFIALAAMILGNWNPIGAMLASLLFGASEAFANQLQSSKYIEVPAAVKPLFNMVPFIVTLIVISGFIGRTRPPAADGIPYEKAE